MKRAPMGLFFVCGGDSQKAPPLAGELLSVSEAEGE